MPIRDIMIPIKVEGLFRVKVFLWFLFLMQPLLSVDTVMKAAHNFILNNLKAEISQ